MIRGTLRKKRDGGGVYHVNQDLFLWLILYLGPVQTQVRHFYAASTELQAPLGTGYKHQLPITAVNLQPEGS